MSANSVTLPFRGGFVVMHSDPVTISGAGFNAPMTTFAAGVHKKKAKKGAKKTAKKKAAKSTRIAGYSYMRKLASGGRKKVHVKGHLRAVA
jgi:hypothetical protein